MKLLKAGLFLLTATLALALPSGAFAEAVVPPGNPAATQYTEALPTSHGPADAEHSKGHQHPDRALGERNAKRLENEGADGREAARVAAETAPQNGGAQAASKGSGAGADSTPQGGDGGKAGGAKGGPPPNPSGSGGGGSGLGNVAGQATGLGTSEGTGLLLPLAILAIAAWGGFYLLRRRKRPAQ